MKDIMKELSVSERNMILEIALKRRLQFPLMYFSDVNDVQPTPKDGTSFDPMIARKLATFTANLTSLGFILTDKALVTLLQIDGTQHKHLGFELQTILDALKKTVGADKEYHPMYPEFPRQVMVMDSAALWLNAILHYLTGGIYRPYPVQEKTVEVVANYRLDKLKPLGVITNFDDILDIFENLMTANGSISEDDKNDLEFYFSSGLYQYRGLPEIPYKENMAVVAKYYMKYASEYEASHLKNMCKTATDVLRFYAAISDADVSLSKPPKFINLSTRQQRLFMNLLANVGNIREDMYRYPEIWKRAGERIHPGRFKKSKYKKVNEAFYDIRAGKKYRSFASKVTGAMNNKDYAEVIQLLETRPGELVRQLDYVARTIQKADADLKAPKGLTDRLLDALSKGVSNVATPVLLQAENHFVLRQTEQQHRIFFPKSVDAQKSVVIDNNLDPLDKGTTEIIRKKIIYELFSRFSKMPSLGKVYLNPDVAGFVVPFSQRSASTMRKICTRGSRIPLPTGTKYFRPYIWWTNEEDGTRVDLDLSVVAYDNNLNRIGNVYYRNLRDTKLGIVHSGDIVNGGDYDGAGAAEFINCDIDKIRKTDIRYIVMTVHIYTMQSGFSCGFKSSAGCMLLDEMSNDRYKENDMPAPFDPKNCFVDFDLTAQGSHCIPLIIDVTKKELIWADLAGAPTCDSINLFGGNNVYATVSSVTRMLYSTLFMPKMTFGTLAMMHIQARATEMVETEEEADTIFSLEDHQLEGKRVIRPYDVDVILSELMGDADL